MAAHTRVLAVALIAILLAGCVTGTAETTVNEDGTLAERQFHLEIDQAVYAILEDEAQRAGYANIEARMTAEAEQVWNTVEYSEEHTDQGVRIVLETADGDPAISKDIEVEISDDEILYVDHEGPGVDRGLNDEYYDVIDLTWTVHMPGEITHTNGNIREDNTSVEWTLSEHGDLDAFGVVSEREAPAGTEESGGWGILSIGAVFLMMSGIALFLSYLERAM